MPPQPFPVLYQLRLVERGPLDDKGEDAGWQATLKLGYGRDADDRTRACIAGVKVGRPVLSGIHQDHDSEEPADLGQGTGCLKKGRTQLSSSSSNR
jgi:hypothetical protein